MSAVLDPAVPEPAAASTLPHPARSGSAARLVTVVAALATVALAVARHSSPPPAVEVVTAFVAVAFAAGGVMLAVRRPGAWACYWLSAIGAALAASIGGAGAAVAAALALGAVLLVTATDGHVPQRWQQIVVAATLAVGAVAALLESSHPGIRLGPLLVEGAVLVAVGLLGFAARCRAASPLERARLQWLGWSLVVAATVGLAALGFDCHPRRAPPAGRDRVGGGRPSCPSRRCSPRTTGPSPRSTASWCAPSWWRGSSRWSSAIYLLVVIGLGHVPTSSDREVLSLVDGGGGGSPRC